MTLNLSVDFQPKHVLVVQQNYQNYFTIFSIKSDIWILIYKSLYCITFLILISCYDMNMALFQKLIDQLHISEFESKCISFTGVDFDCNILGELCPFKAGKRVPFMHSSMKITYIFTLIFQNFNIVAASEFSSCSEINIR